MNPAPAAVILAVALASGASAQSPLTADLDVVINGSPHPIAPVTIVAR